MEFNLKKIASDASGFFNRAKQLTEETFLKAEKTELDAHFENLLQRADKTEEHTKRLLSAMESYLQPNPTIRMEEVFYEKLELPKGSSRVNNLEHLGKIMKEAGLEFGAGTPYGSALLNVAEAETKVGTAERELINTCANSSLLPIRRFLEGDMRTIQRERKVLNTKRLDLDATKSRLRKAKSVEAQANAEADLRVAQAAFDKQSEITKLLLEGIQTAHNSHLKCIRDFVKAQIMFYAQAHQHMTDLQRELKSTVAFRGSSITLPDQEMEQTEPHLALLNNHTSALNSELSRNLSISSMKQAKALFDYQPMALNEIAVTKNEILSVYKLPGMDEEFIMAESRNKKGQIPISYIEFI